MARFAPANCGPDSGDIEFLRRFENCEIGEPEWTHEAHVRIGWVLQMTLTPTEAEDRLRRGILRLNTVVLGRPEQYHETVTLAFARLIRERMREDESWRDFRQRAGDILSGEDAILLRHYSPERLYSDRARQTFVSPDRSSLPGVPKEDGHE